MRTCRALLATRAVLALVLLQGPARAQGAGEEWRLSLEPYLWLPSLESSESVDGQPEIDVDVDVLGDLNAAFPLALDLEAPGRFSFLLEGLYARWREDEGALRTETEIGLIEGAVGYELGSGSKLLLGLRRVELDFDVELGPLAGGASEAWLDPLVGARTAQPLGGDWSLLLWGDVGGFGVGSDFTWQAVALATLRLGTAWRIDLGYRALAIEFDDGDLETSLLAHGPVLGLGLRL